MKFQDKWGEKKSLLIKNTRHSGSLYFKSSQGSSGCSNSSSKCRVALSVSTTECNNRKRWSKKHIMNTSSSICHFTTKVPIKHNSSVTLKPRPWLFVKLCASVNNKRTTPSVHHFQFYWPHFMLKSYLPKPFKFCFS